jgi:hypothetical protein
MWIERDVGFAGERIVMYMEYYADNCVSLER